MKVALSQINVTIGDFEGTIVKVLSQIQKAKDAGAELIVFPELTITGYPPRDLLDYPHFIEKNRRALQAIARKTQGIRVIVGYIEKNKGEGKPYFNAAALCSDGKVREKYFKKLLPSYDVFDEERYFEPGNKLGLWEGNLGISICEDYWAEAQVLKRPLYGTDPIRDQVKAGAKVLINISSSPYSVGKERIRQELLQTHAIQHRLPLIFVNLVGGNDELVFDGRSLVISSEGKVIAKGKAFKEDLLVVDLNQLTSSPEKELEDLESLRQALVLGIRDYVRKCGFKKIALGLSGGIDSALTAVLAAQALGPKNVLGVMMPSPYSSQGSIKDSEKLIKNLKISHKKIPIRTVYSAYRKLFKRGIKKPDLADENLQARIRGNLLMAISNREGSLVLSTGNKSELSVGYCTIYGDMSGGLAVISDLPKGLVYDLSKWINRKKEIIPNSIITKPPSAELRPNQKDQDSLPPYDILDRILKLYIEEHKSEEEIVGEGIPRKTVRWVLKRVDLNEYKRRQAAPGIRVTSKAFGMGRRLPIARKI